MNAVAEIRKKSNEIALVPAAQLSEIVAIDTTAKAFRNAIIEADESGDHTTKALLIARALRTLQRMFTDELMADIMALQGTPLGFRTDRDRPKGGSPGYPIETVRDVVIQAVLRGFQVTGNQINIIAGNLYVTKEGFEQRLQTFEGLSDFEVDFEVPDTSTRQNTALVSCVARWKFNGKLGEVNCTKSTKGDFRIPIKVNEGQSDDAILGKAKSKLFRKVFERLTGMSGDYESSDVVEADTIEPTAERIEQQKPAEPEPIEQELYQELLAALVAIRNRNQFEAAKDHWRTKAINRGLTKGQCLTIGERFALRESQGFA